MTEHDTHRDWPLYPILAVALGVPIGLTEYAELVAYLTGIPPEEVTVVTFAATAPTCAAWLMWQHPTLWEAGRTMPTWPSEASDVEIDRWVARQISQLGATLPILPLPEERRPARSQVEQALTVVPPERLVVVDPESPDEAVRLITGRED